MAAADPVRTRALACLREGRVRVIGVNNDEQWRPVQVIATVRSSREHVGAYRIRFSAGRWSCTCDGVVDGLLCPHASAVALVTMSTVAA